MADSLKNRRDFCGFYNEAQGIFFNEGAHALCILQPMNGFF